MIERFEQVSGTAAAPLRKALKTRVEGTMMKVDLASPLAPGQLAVFEVAWNFLIPEHGADRMGRDGALYELAQWYPRLCVYDDVRGWNTEPYLGQGEFYLEYGDFTLALTVPSGYVMMATGELQNPTEVLTPASIARLAQAAKSDTTVHIITEAELKSGAARPEVRDRNADVEVPREERARRRVGRIPRVPVGRLELAGAPRARAVPPECDRDVEGRRRHGAHVDHGILGALVAVSRGRTSPRRKVRSAAWSTR